MDPISIALGLAQFAPQLVRWITGDEKSAKAAEKAVEIAKVVTGNHDGQQAAAAIAANPELAIKFRQAVMGNETELEKAHLADRQDARKRDAEFIKAGRKNHRADLLAVLAVGGLIVCVWIVAGNPALPAGAREAIMFVAGVFASAVRDVYGFEFGSSRGSKEKDELVGRLSGRP